MKAILLSKPFDDISSFFLQHLNHPRTSESLPPDYNIPNQYHQDHRSYGSVQGQSRIRVIRHDDLAGSGETRSELLIQQTNIKDNGTYFCQAENKAARSVSNFTLHVTDSVDSPTILQVCKKKDSTDQILARIKLLQHLDFFKLLQMIF